MFAPRTTGLTSHCTPVHQADLHAETWFIDAATKSIACNKRLRLSWGFVREDCRKHGHCLDIDFRRYWLIRLRQLRQQLEVIDVERRRGGKENLGLFVAGVAEGVWCTDWDDHVVTSFCIHNLLVLTLGRCVRYVESYSTLSYVECLIMHLTNSKLLISQSSKLGWTDGIDFDTARPPHHHD